MAEKPSLKQILEIYYALRASGVQRLPKPLPRSQNIGSASGRCLFLCDFVSPQRSQDETPPILLRLIDRLSWSNRVQVVSAFISRPKSPQLDPPPEEDLARLLKILSEGEFAQVVCFGWRAAFLLSVAVGQPYALPPEAFEPVRLIEGGAGGLDVLVLPDVRELEAFPEWRGRVWECLSVFA